MAEQGKITFPSLFLSLYNPIPSLFFLHIAFQPPSVIPCSAPSLSKSSTPYLDATLLLAFFALSPSLPSIKGPNLSRTGMAAACWDFYSTVAVTVIGKWSKKPIGGWNCNGGQHGTEGSLICWRSWCTERVSFLPAVHSYRHKMHPAHRAGPSTQRATEHH